MSESKTESGLKFGRWVVFWAHVKLLLAVICEGFFGERMGAMDRFKVAEFMAAVDGLDELPLSRAVALITGDMKYFGLSALQLACWYDEAHMWWGDKRLRGINFDRIRAIASAERMPTEWAAKA